MIEHNGLRYSDDRKTVLKYVGDKTILTKDDFLPGTTTIGADAFKNRGYPSEIELPLSVTKIGNRAFNESLLTKITGTENVDYIGDYAFEKSLLNHQVLLNPKVRLGFLPFYNRPNPILVPFDNKWPEEEKQRYLRNIRYWYQKRMLIEDGLFKETEEILKSHFLDIDYNKRKLVFISKYYNNISVDKDFINVFSTDNLPDIFGGGSPVVNTLYVGHPHIPNKYIPFDDYEFEFLVERTREFCRFVQCLGATEIKILNSNELEEYQHTQSNVNGSANVGIGRFGASANGEHSEELETLNRLKSRVCINQEFSPTRKPYLPDDLVWYQHEPSWQLLYKQRMDGLKNHIEVIELSKSSVLKSSESTSANAELKSLFSYIGISYSEQYQKQLEKSSNAVLRIKVSFAPLDTLGATEQTALPSAKLKACLHKYTLQAPLTDREREIICDCYGISDNECKEMEKSVQNFALSEAEKKIALRIHNRIVSNKPIDEDFRELLCENANISTAREHEIEEWVNLLHTV